MHEKTFAASTGSSSSRRSFPVLSTPCMMERPSSFYGRPNRPNGEGKSHAGNRARPVNCDMPAASFSNEGYGYMYHSAFFSVFLLAFAGHRLTGAFISALCNLVHTISYDRSIVQSIDPPPFF
jgi:hypothetical protein